MSSMINEHAQNAPDLKMPPITKKSGMRTEKQEGWTASEAAKERDSPVACLYVAIHGQY